MIKESLEKLDKVWNYSMDIIGVLLRNLPELTCASIEPNILPLYAGKLVNYENQENYELVDAVCLIDDCMEFGPQAFFDKIAPTALPMYMEIL